MSKAVKSIRELFAIYKKAIDIKNQPEDEDKKIEAYQQVIEQNLSVKKLNQEDIFKYNMIMYWSYNNLADILFKQSFQQALNAEIDNRDAFAASFKCYRRGLKFAQDNMEKISTLNHMADNYKYIGNEEQLCRIKRKVIENFNPEEKRKAYCNIADDLQNNIYAAQMYEEALNYINDEKVSLGQKFNNTILIAEKLDKIYKQENNLEDAIRMENLINATKSRWGECKERGGCQL